MLIKPKDLAVALGISYSALRKHVFRKKVFKSGAFIDTEFPSNIEYISEQTSGKGLDISKLPKGNSKIENIEKITPNVSLPNTLIPKTDEINVFDTLNIKKKKFELLKLEKDNQLKDLQIAKIQGGLMPIDMVEKLLSINIQHILRNFEQAADNIASIYNGILGGNRDHLSEMSIHMREALQRTIEETKATTIVEIKGMLADYAETRSRGERK